MRAFNKIDRPPAAENWVRMNHPDIERTTKNIFNFSKSSPLWSYNPSRIAVKGRIEDRIDLPTALKVAGRGSAPGKPFNEDLVRAFFHYEKGSPIDGLRSFDDLCEWFPLGRDVAVPIKPLAVIRLSGRFTPILLCPWSRVGLDVYQSRLFMTVLERTIFTLTDFQDSDGYVLFFPKQTDREIEADSALPGGRKPLIWRRGDFALLSQSEVNEQIKIFFESRERARELYRRYIAGRPPK